jgi:hypothetical protein
VTSIHPDPTPEEAAAIAAAIALLEDEPPPSGAARVSGWTLAMRHPESSLDEIREMMRAAR